MLSLLHLAALALLSANLPQNATLQDEPAAEQKTRVFRELEITFLANEGFLIGATVDDLERATSIGLSAFLDELFQPDATGVSEAGDPWESIDVPMRLDGGRQHRRTRCGRRLNAGGHSQTSDERGSSGPQIPVFHGVAPNVRRKGRQE